MATYRPLVASANVLQDPQQQRSAARDGSNGNGGVRKEWWWQPGPVDSCCCCCSLRTGVGLLAMDALLAGIWILFYMRTFFLSIMDSLRTVSHDQYAEFCEGPATTTPQCEQLKETMEQAEGLTNVFLHLPTSLYVQAVFAFLAGVIGLWAVFLQSKRAAQVYTLTWPARSVLAVWGALETHSLYSKYGVDQAHTGIVHFISFIFVLYYFKVSWSYYKQRAAHDKAQAESISAPLDTDDDATPMLAMNTIV